MQVRRYSHGTIRDVGPYRTQAGPARTPGRKTETRTNVNRMSVYAPCRVEATVLWHVSPQRHDIDARHTNGDALGGRCGPDVL